METLATTIHASGEEDSLFLGAGVLDLRCQGSRIKLTRKYILLGSTGAGEDGMTPALLDYTRLDF